MPSARPTSVVTGASSGIGSEFARQLASRGHDLILVARRVDLLASLAAEVTARHAVSVEVFPADLSLSDDVDRLCERLGRVEVELLVNNAGFGVSGRFDEVAQEKERAMVDVHVSAVVMLSRAVAPGMVARRRGGIVNVSSIAGLVPQPRSVIYSSTKAFQVVFSEMLDSQLRPFGVRVQALCPGYTVTGFHDTEEYREFDRSGIPRWLWLTAERVVRESLASIEKGPTVCIPSFRYKVIASVGRSWLGGLLARVASKVVRRPK